MANPSFGQPLMGYDRPTLGPGPLHEAGEVLLFTAQKPCRIFGHRFSQGDEALVRLDRNWDEDSDMGEGGPWGWGGYTTATLKRIADHISPA